MAVAAAGGGSPGAVMNAPAPPAPVALSLGGLTQVQLAVGASTANPIPVSGGTGPYTALSANEGVVLPLLSANRLSLMGRAAGTATVTVRDQAGAVVSLAVTVAPALVFATNAPDSITVGLGAAAARTFRVEGGVAPYSIAGNNNNVALVTAQADGNWSIEGVAPGTLTVTLRDATGAQLSRAVTVATLPLAVSSDSLTLPISIPATVVLTGGQPPYQVQGGIPAAITVTGPAGANANEFQIVGSSVTSDVAVVFADAANQTVRTTVNITDATTGLRLSPSALRVSEVDDQPINLTVFGAVGQLQAFSSHLNLLAPRIVGGMIVVEDGMQGRCVPASTVVTITVVDSSRSVATSEITIQDVGPCPPLQFSLQPSSVTLSSSATTAAVQIVGGTAPFTVASSNTAVVTAGGVDANRVLTLNRGTILGTAVVTVTDANGQRSVVTVTNNP